MSYLHLDHDPGASRRWLDSLPSAPGVDVIVLAGDCYSTAKTHYPLEAELRGKYPDAEILLVPGNHDYWRSSPAEVEARWQGDFANDPSVHLAMEPKRFVLRGVELFAGTLWYRRPRPGQEREFVDFSSSLPGLRPWVWDQQRLFEDRFQLSVGRDTVVVSHHLPTARSTPPQFRGSPVDHFFRCDMTTAICQKKPRLWLHGHTHTPCDYEVQHGRGETTRVVCHPRGYPHEWAGRKPYLPLELEV
jgi:predicted phosphodiesterase